MTDCGHFIYQHRELRYVIASIKEGWVLTVEEPDGASRYRCTYTKPNHPYLRILLMQHLNGTDFSGLYWKTPSPIKFAVSFHPAFKSRICVYFDHTLILQEGTIDPIPCGIYIAPFATLIFTYKKSKIKLRPAISHRKIPHNYISKPIVRRLCRRGEVERISEPMYEEHWGILTVYLE